MPALPIILDGDNSMPDLVPSPNGELDLRIVLPQFGTPGVCADYDEDCRGMRAPRVWAMCYAFGRHFDANQGVCPFLD